MCRWQSSGDEDLFYGALSMSLKQLGKPLQTCGKRHLPGSRKQSAHIHRNFVFVEPISGHQWTYATGNAGDMAASSIILPQLWHVHTEKQRPKRKQKRRTVPPSVTELLRSSMAFHPKKRGTTFVQGATASFMRSEPLQD